MEEEGDMKQPAVDVTQNGQEDNNNNDGNNTGEEFQQAVGGNNESTTATATSSLSLDKIPPLPNDNDINNQDEGTKMVHHKHSESSSTSSSDEEDGYSEQHIDGIDDAYSSARIKIEQLKGRRQPPLQDLQSESVSVSMEDNNVVTRAMSQPSAFHIDGPGGGRDANLSTNTLLDNSNNINQSENDNQQISSNDNDADTLGLRWDDEANLGGVELDTSSVAVSAISSITTAPYNIPASPPRQQREGDDEKTIIEQIDSSNQEERPSQILQSESKVKSGDIVIIRDPTPSPITRVLGDVQPGAFHIEGPGGRDANLSTNTLDSNNNINQSENDNQQMSSNDNDADTLGLRWDDEANLGGVELDTSSVAVSAISSITTAPYNIPASPPRQQREGDDEKTIIEQIDSSNQEERPSQILQSESKVKSGDIVIIRDPTPSPITRVLGDVQPGAFHIEGPGGRDANLSTNTLDSNNNINQSENDNQLIPASCELNDQVVAEPVPDDEPMSYAIRMRDEDIEEALRVSTRRGSRTEQFHAVVLDAMPVFSVNNAINLRDDHPNRLNQELNQELNDNIKSFYWQRVAFRICVLISMLGLGLGLGLGGLNGGGNSSDSTDDQQQQGSSSTNEIITLRGEYEGQRFGSSVAMTRSALTILVGSPEEVVFNPTGGMAQLFYLNRTNNHTDDEIMNVASSTSSSLLFSSQGDNASDNAGESVATTPYGEALAIGYGTSKSDFSYVKVFGRNDEDKSYSQIGQTFYGEKVGDGFASSLSIARMFDPVPGLMLLIGSLKGGYAQLWACAEEGKGFGPWSRLDAEGMFTHDGATEIVVEMAGSRGRRVFLGIPGANNNTGIVLSYKVDPPTSSGLFPSTLTAEITEEKELSWSGDKWVPKDEELFMGMNEGDYFGSSISTDKSGEYDRCCICSSFLKQSCRSSNKSSNALYIR